MSGYLPGLANTAILRQAAVDAEKRCDWVKAAELWREALNHYPSTGRLAELDMEKMNQRLNACVASAKDQSSGDPWDAWYTSLPADLRRKLSIHDFKRLGDCFKAAFEGRRHLARNIAHCWEAGPLTDDGYSTTCMKLDGHAGDHEWTRDDQITIEITPGR